MVTFTIAVAAFFGLLGVDRAFRWLFSSPSLTDGLVRAGWVGIGMMIVLGIIGSIATMVPVGRNGAFTFSTPFWIEMQWCGYILGTIYAIWRACVTPKADLSEE